MIPKQESWETPPWHSSYIANNYGELFYNLVRIYQPKKVVELGTKAGYSAYHIARALKDNKKGKLYCYDLWEKYPFHSVPQSLAAKNLRKFTDIVTLNQRDVMGVDKLHQSVDILHIDISNDAEKLAAIIPMWISKVNQFIIFEGGSQERDKIKWMIKYKRPPIRPWLQKYSHFTFEPFPSVTLISKE